MLNLLMPRIQFVDELLNSDITPSLLVGQFFNTTPERFAAHYTGQAMFDHYANSSRVDADQILNLGMFGNCARHNRL